MRTLIVLLIISMAAFAWAPRTHIEIARLAEPLLENDIFPDLLDLFREERGAIYSGTNFPDWANGGYTPQWASRAHSMAFVDKYLEVLMDSFPDFSSPGARRELAFLLGVASHIYGDRVWHSYHTPPGMIGALTMAETEDATTELVIEGALDVIIAYENPIPSFAWFWPYETILKVYHAFGDTDVTIAELVTRCTGLQTGYDAIIYGAGPLSYISSKALIPWTYENYLDYYPGGVGHSSQISVTQWRRLWAKAVHGADYYQRSEYQCGYVDTDDAHLLEAHPENNTGREEMLVAATNDARGRTLLYWNVSSFDTTRRIDSALVYLRYADGTPSGAKTLEAYRLNRSWGEGAGHDGSETTFNGAPAATGEACWTHARYGEVEWLRPGADAFIYDRESAPLSARAFDASSPAGRWYSWNITPAVELWTSSPSANFGIVIREMSESAAGQMLVPSGESKATSSRPALTIFSSNHPVNVAESAPLPENIAITAYPNPFNSSVTISIDGVGAHGRAPLLQVEIYDLAGRVVAEIPVGSRPASTASNKTTGDAGVAPTTREFIWQPAPDLPSGVFLVRARFDGGVKMAAKRVVYLK